MVSRNMRRAIRDTWVLMAYVASHCFLPSMPPVLSLRLVKVHLSPLRSRSGARARAVNDDSRPSDRAVYGSGTR